MNCKMFVSLLATGLISTATLASDTHKGNTIYEKYCSNCHGSDGRGVMATAPDFSIGQGLIKSDRSLVERIEKGDNVCPSFKKVIKERNLYDLVSYIRTLRQ